MKSFFGGVVLVFLLVATFLAEESWAAAPTLKIISPQPGEKIPGYVVKVKFEVRNFTLKDHRLFTQKAAGQGHLLFWLDAANTDPSLARKWSREADFVIADVPPGDHTLWAELVGNDNVALGPPVNQSVNFTTEVPGGGEVKKEASPTATAKATVAPTSAPSSALPAAEKLAKVKRPLLFGLGSLGLGFFGFLLLRR